MYDLGMLISLSRRHVWNAASRKLEASEYSMLTWALLGCLVKGGPATQRDIASAIGQHPAGVSRLIDEMVAQNLVRRRRDEIDRRRAHVEVTRSGGAMFKAAHPLVLSALKEALRGLSRVEQRELSRLLRKLLSVDTTLDIDRIAKRGVSLKRAAPVKRASPVKRAAPVVKRATPARHVDADADASVNVKTAPPRANAKTARAR